MGLVAASFAAVYPNLWLIDSLLYPEGLMALLVTVTMIVAYRWRDRPRLATAALLGAVIGLAALARGEGDAAAPTACSAVDRSHPIVVPRRPPCVTSLSPALACVAVLAPWMIRNATTFEKFVPLSTNGNEVMVYANCASAYNGQFVGYWDFSASRQVRDAQGDPPGDESQTALYWRSLGFDYARDHVGELPRVVTLRVLRQWELFRPLQNVTLGGIEGRNRDASTMGLMMFYGLAGLSIVGVVSMRRRRIPVLPLVRPVPRRHDHLGLHLRHRAVPRPGRTGAVRPRRGRSGTGPRVLRRLAGPGAGSDAETSRRRSVRARRSRRPASALGRGVATRGRGDVGGDRIRLLPWSPCRSAACTTRPAARWKKRS